MLATIRRGWASTTVEKRDLAASRLSPTGVTVDRAAAYPRCLMSSWKVRAEGRLLESHRT
jgi:hypothetical protein